MNDFATSFSVDQKPEEVFDAIANVRGWWSEEIVGGTAEPGDEFTYRYEDVHRCRIRVAEVVPGCRVSWLELENHFDFTADKAGWTGNGTPRNLITTGEGQPNTRGDWAAERPQPPARSADAPRAASTEVPA